MEQTFVLQEKKIEEIFDVVVVGGGLSGVMAAIAATREGKRALLVEKYGFLGGMATAGLVNPFMPYMERGNQTPANAGLFAELLTRLAKYKAMSPWRSVEFKEQILKLILDEMVRSAGVKVFFHAHLCGVEKEGERIKYITLSTISGNIDIYGKCYVDATGNGDLFARAGVEFFLRNGPEEFNQPMTTCFRVSNVEWKNFQVEKAQALYKEFQKEGKIKNPRENILAFGSPMRNILHFNTTRVIRKNPCDVEERTEAEFLGREQTFEMYNFLKENLEEFQDSELVLIADEIGIRESRRVLGEYILNERDILGTHKFEDSIARGTYEVDIHNPNGSGTTLKYIPEHDYYTIPYRSLLPVGCDNLIVAGRAISCTHEAHSAIRIMPITSCIGEAAGIAATIAVAEGISPKRVDAKKIQAILQKHGGLF